MVDHTNTNHTIRETRVEKRGTGGMALVVGAIIVVLAIVAWAVFGGGDRTTTERVVPAAETTNINVEPAPAPAAPVETAPAVEPAPAAPAPSGN